MKPSSTIVFLPVLMLLSAASEAAPLVVVSQSSSQYQLENSETPESSARRFLKDSAGELGIRADLSDLILDSVTSNPVGYVVRFQQVARGLPIVGATLTVSMSKQLAPLTYINSTVRLKGNALENERFSPAKISEKEALLRTYAFLKLSASPVKEEVVSMARHERGLIRSVYQIRLSAPIDRRYAWEVVMDQEDGTIYRSVNLILNQRHAALPVSTNAFDPNPTIRSGKAVDSISGYSDANNANSDFFQSMMTPVTLDNLTQQGGKFLLAGPNVVISDSESPKNPDCSIKNDQLKLTRNDACFDAVNTYYFIDKVMKYLNGNLGFDAHPIKYKGGVKVDPHGLNGEDNSHYSPFSDELAFGQGGVDDAQDHDVIIHELGHAIHNWVTKGNISQVEGLSEGSGDYWAASYDRQFMKPGHVAYNWTFSFDGHNKFWPGRTLAVSGNYPAAAQGEIHSAGQLWASVCMDIYDAIGKEKADKLFWSALSNLDSRSNQADAAKAYVVAAKQLYPSDLETVISKFKKRGYPVR